MALLKSGDSIAYGINFWNFYSRIRKHNSIFLTPAMVMVRPCLKKSGFKKEKFKIPKTDLFMQYTFLAIFCV